MTNQKGFVKKNALGLALCAILTANGIARGASVPFSIATGIGDQSRPSAILDRDTNRFFVVWADLRNGRSEVYGRFVNADGTLFGNEIKVSESGNNRKPSLVYDSTRQRILVLWSNLADGGRHTSILGRWIRADGNLGSVQSVFNDATADADNPRGGFDTALGQFFLVWDCYCKDAKRRSIFGGSFTSDLLPNSRSFAITAESIDSQFPDVAFDPNAERFLVVWRRTDSANQSQGGGIEGRLITSNMGPSTFSFHISSGPAVSPGTVATDPINKNFLVGWVDNNSDLLFQSVTSEGSRSGSPFAIARSVQGQPAVVYNSATGRFLVSYNSGGDIILDEIFDDSAVGQPSVLTAQVARRGDSVTLAYNPASRRILAAWSQAGAALPNESDIYGTIVASITATPPPLSIASSLTPDTPANLAQALSLYQGAERNWNAGEWAKAEAAYREFLRQYPDYWLAAPAHANLGFQLSFLRDREAEAQYMEAISKAPGTRTAHRAKLGMAALYYAWGEYAKARDLFREVLTESKDWDLTKYATRQLKAVNLRLRDNAASSQK